MELQPKNGVAATGQIRPPAAALQTCEELRAFLATQPPYSMSLHSTNQLVSRPNRRAKGRHGSTDGHRDRETSKTGSILSRRRTHASHPRVTYPRNITTKTSVLASSDLRTAHETRHSLRILDRYRYTIYDVVHCTILSGRMDSDGRGCCKDSSLREFDRGVG